MCMDNVYDYWDNREKNPPHRIGLWHWQVCRIHKAQNEFDKCPFEDFTCSKRLRIIIYHTTGHTSQAPVRVRLAPCKTVDGQVQEASPQNKLGTCTCTCKSYRTESGTVHLKPSSLVCIPWINPRCMSHQACQIGGLKSAKRMLWSARHGCRRKGRSKSSTSDKAFMMNGVQ